MVCRYNIVGNGQTQPEVIFVASGFFTAVKAVKYFCFLLITDSDTSVRNFDFKMFIPVIGRQADFSALRCIADGIVEEDCEYLYNALTVTHAVRKGILGKNGVYLNVLCGCHVFKSLTGIQNQCVELGAHWLDVEMPCVAAEQGEHVIQKP